MDVGQLNFHHLFYFWQVASLGQLTQAAQQLHTSQSALSSQIRQLELRLGEDLFTREGRRLVLTQTGHLVKSYCDNIFGLSQEMLGRLNGQSAGILRLRIGSVATLSRNYLENWIRPMFSNPSAVLTLESGLLDGLLDRLLHHQLDVVLANEAVPANAERRLHCWHLGSQPVSVVGPRRKWAGRTLRTLADLSGQDIVLPSHRHALRGQFDAMCTAENVAPKVRAEVDDMATLRLLARDSGWLALLPDVVVQDELQAGHLQVVAQMPDLKERFFAITTPHRLQHEGLEQLLSTHTQRSLSAAPSV